MYSAQSMLRCGVDEKTAPGCLMTATSSSTVIFSLVMAR